MALTEKSVKTDGLLVNHILTPNVTPMCSGIAKIYALQSRRHKRCIVLPPRFLAQNISSKFLYE